MEEKRSFLNMCTGLFSSYGVIVVIFIILDLAVGEEAQGYSTFFEYGNKGFSISTLIQIFALAFIISVLRNVFLSDKLIKSMSIIMRNVLFFLLITVSIIVFVVAFGWFPIDDAMAWLGFIVSFSVCSAIGVVVSRIRETNENEKMQRALEKYNNDK